MTISSSLNAGVSGLSANASRLAAISDNIANASTYGYKRMETNFHSLVTSSTGGAYAAGGVNVTSQRLVDQSGTIVATQNPMDLAVRGRGFLPVTNTAALGKGDADLPAKIVTTGSFRPNKDGYLVSSGGLALLGWKANLDGTIPNMPRDSFRGLKPVRLDRTEYKGEPTTKAAVGANLPASQATGTGPSQTQSLSIEYFDNFALPKSLDMEFKSSATVANTWDLTIRDSAGGGNVIGTYTLTFDATQANGGKLSSVTNNTGGTYDPATGDIALTVAGGSIVLNIGKPGGPGGMTQVANRFVPGSSTKNGFPPGNLTSIEADEKGMVSAYFDNGIRRVIAQIPLADVANPLGLKFHDDQTYTMSRESGQMLLWSAGEGPTSGLLSYSREESATDIAGELTKLITTQRAYSSNAKVVQTVDEMLQETTNMKR